MLIAMGPAAREQLPEILQTLTWMFRSDETYFTHSSERSEQILLAAQAMAPGDPRTSRLLLDLLGECETLAPAAETRESEMTAEQRSLFRSSTWIAHFLQLADPTNGEIRGWMRAAFQNAPWLPEFLGAAGVVVEYADVLSQFVNSGEYSGRLVEHVGPSI